MPLLSVKNLSTSFHTRDGIINAVKSVTFDIEAGQNLAIVGESGSGKSVCCHSILQLIPRPPGKIESGTAIFDDIDLLSCPEKVIQGIRGNRISMVFQDPMTSLNPYLTIGQQLIEPLTYHQSINKAKARIKAESVLEEVGISNASKRLDQYPHEFSGGMRQRVMIAMALMSEPDLLIADEPTTALDVTIQAQIFELIAQLQKKRNLAVIFITHDLGAVAQISDYVLVMKNGEIVERGSTAHIFNHTQHEYTKMLLSAIPNSAKPQKYRFVAEENIQAILDVKNLSTSYVEQPATLFKKAKLFKAVDDVSISLQRGEVLGLVGESGCGKSSLAKTILRLVSEDTGSIKLEGLDLTQLKADEIRSTRKNIQIIFQDPYASLNPRMSVYDILLEPLKLHKIVPRTEYLEKIVQLMEEVGLSASDIRKYPHEFSGGQRQRIAIARALAVKPELIIADEPVSALDVTIQAQVLELLLSLVEKYQLSMIFVSHDLSVIRYISDRTAVMQQGKILEINDTETLFNNPRDEYTRELLAAIPIPDPARYGKTQ